MDVGYPQSALGWLHPTDAMIVASKILEEGGIPTAWTSENEKEFSTADQTLENPLKADLGRLL
jgi:hypothetical protein